MCALLALQAGAQHSQSPTPTGQSLEPVMSLMSACLRAIASRQLRPFNVIRLSDVRVHCGGNGPSYRILTWAMLLIGFAGIGFAARRQRQRRQKAAYNIKAPG